MKKKNLVLLALLLGTVFLLNACATKPITQQYPERWEKTYIGMSLDEFKQIWTDAKGPFQDVNNNITFTFSPPTVPFTAKTQVIYFSFKDNILVSFNEY